ncbi:hypothetical protein KVG29_06250 [Caldicoprobacter algeriensis]|uniref:hypothetical protein n=1 Tax=Caldicoprobacter algeriensis TaxID=699281 RepID=UPI002079FFD2|nr:hypothetical protein [Caldicoprobacter algeriensis]MCM8900828.1 hypothetical protein [Caldicoprobacter algeriensis]
MRARVKGMAVAMVSILLLAAVAVSIWLVFYKGIKQDKTYSGARFVYEEVEDRTTV